MPRPFLIGLAAVGALSVVALGAWRLLQEQPRARLAATPQATARPQASPAPAQPPRMPAPPRTLGKPAAVAPAARAPSLRVSSDVPAASVFLDHKHVGTAPLELADLAPGPHRLNVSAEGYEMYGEMIEIGEGTSEIAVRFKEVRLEESLSVVHKHGIGSCSGRLVATTVGLAYETERRQDAFRLAFAALEPLEVDYLARNLKVKQRGGRSFNFTDQGGGADALLVFQKKVEAARSRLSAGS